MASQANTAKQLTNKLKHEQLRFMKNSLNLTFNKTCKKRNLIPNYIKIIINNNSEAAEKTLIQAKRLWLSNEIKSIHKKASRTIQSIKIIKLQLKAISSKKDYDTILQKIKDQVKVQKEVKMKTIQKKLEALLAAQVTLEQPPKQEHKFYPRVVNFTAIEFEEKEKSLLGKWPKFNPPTNPNNNNDVKQLIVETETALTYVSKEKRDKIRYEAVRKIENVMSNSKKRRLRDKRNFIKIQETIKQIKNKVISNDVTIVPADKSNASVVLSNNDLNEKVKDFFEKNEVIEVEDKTKEYNKSIKMLIDNSCVIHPNKRKWLYNSKASPPQFKPLIKTHKEGYPVRPVINCMNSPSYAVSKYLSNLIRANLDLQSQFICKNSKHFIDKVEQVGMDKSKILISLDIDNMYANIPKAEAIISLKKMLNKSENFSDSEVEDIVKIVGEIIEQNYFTWKGRTYHDSKGLPMGGPLSALLAEIYIQEFETSEILNLKNRYFKNIDFYCRYVDDIFMVFKGTKRQAALMVDFLNKVHKTITFKLESEKNNVINFLDIKLIKSEKGLEFGIFRKPTQTDLVIPKESNHPISYKLSAFRSMVHRLLTYKLSPSEFNKEKNIIKEIAFNNGYEVTMITNMIRKVKMNLLNKENSNKINNEKFVPFGYTNKNSELIGNIFKKSSFYPGYKINKQYPWKNRVSRSKEQQRGVYLIKCDDNIGCEKRYIGYTNRTFKERFKEHSAQHQKNPTSVFAQHLKNNPNHKVSFENSLHVLKQCNNKEKSKVIEEYCIYKNFLQYGKEKMLNKKEEYSEKITFQLYNQLEEAEHNQR